MEYWLVQKPSFLQYRFTTLISHWGDPNFTRRSMSSFLVPSNRMILELSPLHLIILDLTSTRDMFLLQRGVFSMNLSRSDLGKLPDNFFPSVVAKVCFFFSASILFNIVAFLVRLPRLDHCQLSLN